MKVDGAPEQFEDTILEGFKIRMSQLMEKRKLELKKAICDDIDRMADEELAKVVMSIKRWSRVEVKGDVLTIEIHKPGVKREEPAQ
jgi:hypothetical protein